MSQWNESDSWQLRYMPGGRELLQALGQELVVGESFIFLGPRWGRVPLISSILKAAGVSDVPAKIFPLWGNAEIEVPGAKLRQRPVPRTGLCSLWTDRQMYREGRDPVRVIMSNPFQPSQQIDLEMLHEGKPFGRQPLYLDERGLCLVELQDLPMGRYRLQTPDGLSSAEFTVALSRLCTMSAEWIQQYTQELPGAQSTKRSLVFVLQVQSFGAGVQGDIAVQLLDESGETPRPLAQNIFRADGAGRVAGELMLEGDGPFSVEIHALSDSAKWCTLQVSDELSQAPRPKRSVICPLGTVKTWEWSGEGGLLGFRVEEEEAWQSTPVVLVSVSGNQAILRAETELTEAMVLVLDPVTGQRAEHRWPALSQGQHLELAIPRPGGILAVGGWVKDEPWEGWSLAIPASTTSLTMSLLPRHSQREPLQIELHTNHPEEVPVYVVVREEEEEAEERPWGPSASFQAAAREVTREMSVGYPERSLWRVAQKNKRVVADPQESMGPRGTPPGMPPRMNVPRPSMPPPGASAPGQGVPPPSTPPPGGASPETFKAGAPPRGPVLPDWERPPPQHEHFSKTLFCGIVPVQERHVFSVELPDEHAQVQVEAVALAGPSWAYAKAETTHGTAIFAELLLPTTCHPEDAITGEAIVMSQHDAIQVSMWCGEQQVPLYLNGELVEYDDVFRDELLELDFQVSPGHYILQIRDGYGQELERVEADVAFWGERVGEGWGLKIVPAGGQWSQQVAGVDAEALPDLHGPLQRVVRNLLERGAGHCETEAARVCAAAYGLQFAKASHEETVAYHQLLQGLERLEGMRMQGMGFRLFPGGPHEPQWGIEAVKHLWELAWLAPSEDMPGWHQRLLQIADEMAHAYHLPSIPTRIQSTRDAYRVFTMDPSHTRREEALWEVEKRCAEMPDGSVQIASEDPIQGRKESCYGAMVLLSSPQDEHRSKGLLLANEALRQWSAEESGYSTGEGVALLALLGYCQRFLPPHSPASAQIDGASVEWGSLMGPQPLQQLQVTGGVVPLGLRYSRITLPAMRFSQTIPWQLRLHRPGVAQGSLRDAEVGDRLQLTIQLRQRGQIGDVVEFLLPPALCWLDGERDEKNFAVEVAGQQQIELPLIAVSTTHTLDGNFGPQHWGVRIFNLHDGTRGNEALDHAIVVHPPGHKRREQGVFRKWRKIFG